MTSEDWSAPYRQGPERAEGGQRRGAAAVASPCEDAGDSVQIF
jgi:hypothetical protein